MSDTYERIAKIITERDQLAAVVADVKAWHASYTTDIPDSIRIFDTLAPILEKAPTTLTELV